jgi:hypothetical protein
MIRERIQYCAANKLDELVRRMRLSERFTIELDERTNVVNGAVLPGFVRYVYKPEFRRQVIVEINGSTNRR